MASPSHEDSSASLAAPAGARPFTLEEILTTQELTTRPSRAPDYKGENEALVELAKHMAKSPDTLLERLSEIARSLCRAGSAGVSLEETDKGEEVFRWCAIDGPMKPHLGTTMPRDFSPCGATVIRGETLMMCDPARHYTYGADLTPAAKEVLLVPFYSGERPVGTVWIVNHETAGAFDAEDARILSSLSLFAAAAYDALSGLKHSAQVQFQLQEVHFKLEAALHAGSIATWSWDIVNDRVHVNDLGAQLFSVSKIDANGGPISAYIDSIHPEDRERVTEQIQNAMENGVDLETEYRLKNKDDYIWVIARGGVLRDSQGRPIQFPGVLVDITARKLAQLNEAAQQHEAREDLRQAHDKVVASAQAKDDFLAALSHELRTPLNPALLLASEASRNPDYPREARLDFESIRKNIELEARLIDDLLDVTRIASGKFILYRALKDLHLIVRDATDKVTSDAQDKKITLTWALNARDSFVYGDPVRLQQVFWNVIRNAVKFTPVGGRIHIESLNSPESRNVSFLIHDSGIGMDQEELNRIFEAFAQGHHADALGSHLFGGLGLGLAISKKIVEAHSGRISATSLGKNHGSTFIIELPTTTLGEIREDSKFESLVSLTSAPWTTAPPEAAQSLRILIVEDHADTRRVLQRLLTRRSHEVSGAGSGEETLAMMSDADNVFDLVICDIGLPDTDGYTLLPQIHQQRPGLPAIAMTGYGMESDQERSASAGFLAHLTKPVSLAALDDTLRGLALGKYQA